MKFGKKGIIDSIAGCKTVDMLASQIRIKVAFKLRRWNFKSSWPIWVSSIFENWCNMVNGKLC